MVKRNSKLCWQLCVFEINIQPIFLSVHYKVSLALFQINVLFCTQTHTHNLLSPYNGTEFTWFWCLSHCIGYLIGKLSSRKSVSLVFLSFLLFFFWSWIPESSLFFIDISMSICIILVQVLFKRHGCLDFTDEAFLTHRRHSLTENLLFFWLLPSSSMALEHQVKSGVVHVALGMGTPRPHVPKRFVSLFWQVA